MSSQERMSQGKLCSVL